MLRRYSIYAEKAKVFHMSDKTLQNFPEHQYPSIVGRPILRSEERQGDIVVKDIMCGDEAAAARSMLQITYPVRLLKSRSIHTKGTTTDRLATPRWKMEL
jgi:hypothetical protein